MNNWIDIREIEPNNGDRLLVWDSKFHQAQILTWNSLCKLWDDESGDDLYSRHLNRYRYYMEIPEFVRPTSNQQ